MRIFMTMAFRFLGCMIFFSCGNPPEQVSQQPEQILKQEERCQVDGTNVLIWCKDGRTKVVPLGFGDILIIKNQEMPQAKEFCTSEPREIIINAKNSHIVARAVKTNRIRLYYQKSIHTDCTEIRQIQNPKEFKNFQMNSIPLTSPPPKEEEF